MAEAPAYIRPVDMRHEVRMGATSMEKRRKVARDNEARCERQGKKVVRLHSRPPGESYNWLHASVADYCREYGAPPAFIFTDRRPKTKATIFQIPGFGMVELRIQHKDGLEGVELG